MTVSHFPSSLITKEWIKSVGAVNKVVDGFECSIYRMQLSERFCIEWGAGSKKLFIVCVGIFTYEVCEDTTIQDLMDLTKALKLEVDYESTIDRSCDEFVKGTVGEDS